MKPTSLSILILSFFACEYSYAKDKSEDEPNKVIERLSNNQEIFGEIKEKLDFIEKETNKARDLEQAPKVKSGINVTQEWIYFHNDFNRKYEIK